MKFIALGRTKLLYDSILSLVESGHEPLLIITSKATPEYSITENDFEKLAKNLKVPFIFSKQLDTKSNLELINKLKPDIGVSVNWNQLIPLKLLQSFKLGVLNAHAGDLPKFKGNAVPNWAILSGEKKIALTIHFMDEGLDSGRIIEKKYYKLNENTTITEIYEFLEKSCPQLFVTSLNKISKGFRGKPQSKNLSLHLRCYPRIPKNSEINWNSKSIDIIRLINASCEPFSGAYTFLDMKKLTIWKARRTKSKTKYLAINGQIISINNNEVTVSCSDGFIVLESVSLSDDIKRKPSEIIKSVRKQLGMDIPNQILDLESRLSKLENLTNIKNMYFDKNYKNKN